MFDVMAGEDVLAMAKAETAALRKQFVYDDRTNTLTLHIAYPFFYRAGLQHKSLGIPLRNDLPGRSGNRR